MSVPVSTIRSIPISMLSPRTIVVVIAVFRGPVRNHLHRYFRYTLDFSLLNFLKL
ncbi:MAG: hypothetical protein N2515_08690 [Deltaproteobacteria bacterium]|nr:hypothetical protein [Deltaproteobacteria bacterium]